MLKKSMSVLFMGLVVSSTAFGCKPKEEAAASEKSADKTATTTTTTPTTSASSAEAEKAEPKTTEVSAASLLEGSDDAHGVLSTADAELGGIDAKKAPVISSGDLGASDEKAAPTAAPTGAAPGDASAAGAQPKIQWLHAGVLQVPNPGWKPIKTENPKVGVLGSPDEKAALIFAPYSTGDEAVKTVNNAMGGMKLQNIQWKKPEIYKIGPDNLPAKVGVGKAMMNGKPVRVLYAMIESGAPEKLLVIGLSEDSKEAKKAREQGLAILGHIKKR